MNRLTAAEVISYLFFFAVIAGLLALEHWNEKVLSFITSTGVSSYLPFTLNKEHILYACLVLAFLLVIAFWEKERAREQLQYSFLTVVTHKFRTPLAGIKWAVNNLREEKTLEERKDLLQEVENATERITQTVDTLTGLAKFSDSLAYAYEAVSLRSLVEQSIRKFSSTADTRKVRFEIQASSDVPLIVIDRQKIQFVIDVLMENAIKYSKEGNVVSVGVRKEGKNVLLSVSDEGIGISAVDRARIFNRFYRAKEAKERDPDGMGLSLPLVRTVMRHHRGNIEVYSRGRGKGSTFIVRFPLR